MSEHFWEIYWPVFAAQAAAGVCVAMLITAFSVFLKALGEAVSK